MAGDGFQQQFECDGGVWLGIDEGGGAAVMEFN